MQVQAAISQNLDTRYSPKLDDIQLELGNIQIRFDGAGTLDYIIEFGINVLPNMLRYQVMDAIETPLKKRIQNELDKIDTEKLILDNAENMETGKLGDISNFLNL